MQTICTVCGALWQTPGRNPLTALQYPPNSYDSRHMLVLRTIPAHEKKLTLQAVRT